MCKRIQYFLGLFQSETNWNPGRDPFNQNFRKFRSKTQWIGSVQPGKFRKNRSTFWGGPLFPVGPVWILVEWIAPPGIEPLDIKSFTERGILHHSIDFRCYTTFLVLLGGKSPQISLSSNNIVNDLKATKFVLRPQTRVLIYSKHK